MERLCNSELVRAGPERQWCWRQYAAEWLAGKHRQNNNLLHPARSQLEPDRTRQMCAGICHRSPGGSFVHLKSSVIKLECGVSLI